MKKLLKGLLGHYRLYICNECHVYSRKINLNKGCCSNCNGEVRKV